MKCIVCGYDQQTQLYKVLLKCKQCGFVWADEETTQNFTENIHNSDYFNEGEYLDYIVEKEALQKNFKRNLKYISTYKKDGRLLELGCAYGFFLELAKEIYEAEGVDICREGAEYAKKQLGLNAVCGDFLDIEYEKESYDIIVSWATLEHLKDPHNYIEKISDLLKDNGVFVLSTVDIDSMLARIHGGSWRQIHPPSHWSYFSVKTIKNMLSNYGLQTIDIRRFGEYRTVANVIYNLMMNTKYLNKNIVNFLKKHNLGTFYFNTYDTIYVAAEKIRD